MILYKLAALVILCAAIWIVVHLVMTAGDPTAGAAVPTPGEESALRRLLSPAEPTPPPDPRFSR